MGFAIFRNNPTSASVQSFLERAIHNATAAPKFIIGDKGQPFWCDAFKHWCNRRNIKPRFGADWGRKHLPIVALRRAA